MVDRLLLGMVDSLVRIKTTSLIALAVFPREEIVDKNLYLFQKPHFVIKMVVTY